MGGRDQGGQARQDTMSSKTAQMLFANAFFTGMSARAMKSPLSS